MRRNPQCRLTEGLTAWAPQPHFHSPAGLRAFGMFDKGITAAANDRQRGQSTFLSDMFSAEQAETNADMGWLKATQTDTFLREKMGAALANIDAVMANTGTADNSPSGWAVKNRYENQADYARDVTMFNNKMQVQSDRNAAQLYMMAA